MEIRKIILAGHSLAVTIPSKFLKILDVGGGEHVELFMSDKDTLIIRKHALNGRRKAGDGGK